MGLHRTPLSDLDFGQSLADVERQTAQNGVLGQHACFQSEAHIIVIKLPLFLQRQSWPSLWHKPMRCKSCLLRRIPQSKRSILPVQNLTRQGFGGAMNN
jgi:hypothetical protein